MKNGVVLSIILTVFMVALAPAQAYAAAAKNTAQRSARRVKARPVAAKSAVPSPSLYQNVVYNLHVVCPGMLYRSAQLSAETLAQVIEQYGIKTVINLRGKSPHKQWWNEEQAMLEQLGVRYFNLAMSAHRYPYPQQIDSLLEIFRKAPKPILVHCRGGADRTGEACALWKLFMEGESVKESLKQLDIKYRHLQMLAPLKRQFIEEFGSFFCRPAAH